MKRDFFFLFPTIHWWNLHVFAIRVELRHFSPEMISVALKGILYSFWIKLHFLTAEDTKSYICQGVHSHTGGESVPHKPPPEFNSAHNPMMKSAILCVTLKIFFPQLFWRNKPFFYDSLITKFSVFMILSRNLHFVPLQSLDEIGILPTILWWTFHFVLQSFDKIHVFFVIFWRNFCFALQSLGKILVFPATLKLTFFPWFFDKICVFFSEIF